MLAVAQYSVIFALATLLAVSQGAGTFLTDPLVLRVEESGISSRVAYPLRFADGRNATMLDQATGALGALCYASFPFDLDGNVSLVDACPVDANQSVLHFGLKGMCGSESLCEMWGVLDDPLANLGGSLGEISSLSGDAADVGISLGFWLRATTHTEGVVFEFLENWRTAAGQFNNWTASPYAALMLRPGGTLTWSTTVRMPNMPTEGAVVDDVVQLPIGALDGEWHWVGLTISSPSFGSRTVRMYVDGFGSYQPPYYHCAADGRFGWLRAPSPLLTSSTPLHSGGVLVPNGVMRFGLVNGSLFQLQMVPVHLTQFELLSAFALRGMTDQMSITRPFAFSFSIAMAFLFLVMLVVTWIQIQGELHSLADDPDAADDGDANPQRSSSAKQTEGDLIGKGTSAVGGMKQNVGAISSTLQASQNSTSVFQQLSVLLPIVLSVPQSLALYLKSLEWPSTFRVVVDKFLWISSFDLTDRFTVPPYLTLIFQFALVVLAMWLVRRLLQADQLNFHHTSIRYRITVTEYVKALHEVLIRQLVPRGSDGTTPPFMEVAKWIASRRTCDRESLSATLEAANSIFSMGWEPADIIVLAQRCPLAPTRSLQSLIFSALQRCEWLVDDADSATFSDLLLTYSGINEVHEEISVSSSQHNCSQEAPILEADLEDRSQSEKEDVRNRPLCAGDETNVDSSTTVPKEGRSVGAERDTSCHSGGNLDYTPPLPVAVQRITEHLVARFASPASETSLMMNDVVHHLLSELSRIAQDALQGLSSEGEMPRADRDLQTTSDEWLSVCSVLSPPDMPFPVGQTPLAAFSVSLYDPQYGHLYGTVSSSGLSKVLRASNSVSRFSELRQSCRISNVLLSVGANDNNRRLIPECYVRSAGKALCLVVGSPSAPVAPSLSSKTPVVAPRGATAVGGNDEEEEEGNAPSPEWDAFVGSGVECYLLLITNDSGHRCPQHAVSLIQAREDRHLSLSSLGDRPLYQCAHRCAFGAKRCLLETKDFPPCSLAELWVCSHDDCSYAMCKSCWDAIPAQSKGITRVGIMVEVAAADVFYTVRHLPGGLLYVLAITVLQSLSFPVMQGSIAILSCHPSIRCDFPSCTVSDTTYLVALVLSILLLVTFHVGMTCLWTGALLRRFRMVSSILRSTFCASPSASSTATEVALDAVEEHIPLWSWFLESDRSVLSCFYRKYEARFMAMEPVFLLLLRGGQCVAIAATDPDSWQQLIAIACCEAVCGLLWLTTSPFVDPWQDALVKVGSCHQLLQLSWLGLYHYCLLSRNANGLSGVSAAMLSTSGFYGAFVVAVTMKTVVVPLVIYMRQLQVRGFGRREQMYVADVDDRRVVSNLRGLLKEKQRFFRDTFVRRWLFGLSHPFGADVPTANEALTHAHIAHRLLNMSASATELSSLPHLMQASRYFSSAFGSSAAAPDAFMATVQVVMEHEPYGWSFVELPCDVLRHAAAGLRRFRPMEKQDVQDDAFRALVQRHNANAAAVLSGLCVASQVAHAAGFATAERNLILLRAYVDHQLCGTALKPLNLSRALLSKADLNHLHLHHVDMRFANLSRASCVGTYWDSVNTERAVTDGWQVQPTAPVNPIVCHGHSESICTVMSRGGQLMSAGADELVVLWSCNEIMSCFDRSKSGPRIDKDAAEAPVAPTQMLKAHNMAILCLDVSVDGCFAVSGGEDEQVVLWKNNSSPAVEEATGSGVWEFAAFFSGHKDAVRCVCFFPDSLWVASSGADKCIMLWSVASHQCVRSLNGHSQGLVSLAVHPDGTRMASAGIDRFVALWDVSQPSRGSSLPDQQKDSPRHVDVPNRVGHLEFSPDGCTLAASCGAVIILWSASSLSPQLQLTGHVGVVTSFRFSSDGTVLASASHDGSCRLWSRANGSAMVVFEFVSLSASIATSRNRLLRSVCFLEDTAAGGGGDEVAVMVAGGQGVIAVWPLSHRSASRVNASATKVRCVVLGCPLVVGGLTLSEPAGGHEGHLSATTIFGCGDGSSVRGWNAINGELLLQLQVDPAAKEIPCLAYDEASATLFVGSCVGVVNVFDVSTGDFLREIKGHGPSTRVNGMCHVTTDRQVGWILTAGDDGEVRWWSATEGESSTRLASALPSPVLCISAVVCCSPKMCCQVFVGCLDRSVRMYSLVPSRDERAPSCVESLCCFAHRDFVTSIAGVPLPHTSTSSSSGFLSAGADGEIIFHYFNPENSSDQQQKGSLLLAQSPHHHVVHHIEWFPHVVRDAWWLVSCSEDGVVAVWSARCHVPLRWELFGHVTYATPVVFGSLLEVTAMPSGSISVSAALSGRDGIYRELLLFSPNQAEPAAQRLWGSLEKS